MKEYLKLRVNYNFYNLLFSENEGKNLGTSVKVIEISKEDPRYKQVPIFDEKVRNKYNKAFFFGWEIKRKYSKKELDLATLFHLKIKAVFEPAGEECGTEYDENTACQICGANRKQISPLRLKKGKIPKKDIAQTIAGEVVVSAKFKNVFESNDLTGIEFKHVYSKNKPIDYYQIIPTSPNLKLTENTIAGVDPFDFSESSNRSELTLPGGYHFKFEKEVYKCPKGHTIGLNLLSEVYVRKFEEIKSFDFFKTQQKLGVKRGLLRPEPLYLCSKKFREIIKKEKLSGFNFEVANIE